ncbi:MAG: ROK family transcriptional regulator [Bacillota bacterium]
MRHAKPASNSRDVKVLNRLLVRNTIRKLGPIARHEVAKVTGLTPPTVTVIVNEMIRSGIVKEVGRGISTGGRRPVMLELNPCAGFILAVRIQHGEIVTAILDLAGTILETQRLEPDTSAPGNVVNVIGTSFDNMTERLGIKNDQVLWCGVASPGLIDSHRGIVARSSNLAWQNVALGEALSGRLGRIPVHVENISNAAALGEKMYGVAQGCANLIYLNLSVGIGAGIIIDNQIYGGAHGYAGEVGHVAVYPENGPICACGQRGCFEVVCGVRAVLARVKSEVSDETFTALGLSKERVTVDDIVRSGLANTPEVQRILHETGKTVGLAIANLVSLFNTEMVILGGELSRAGDFFLDAVNREARERALREIIQAVKIVRSTMATDPALMGAYSLAIEDLFSVEEWRRPCNGT